MFVIGKHKERGSLLLGAIILLTVVGVFFTYSHHQTTKLLQMVKSDQYRTDRKELTRQLALSIDCDRTLAGYNASNLCPENQNISILRYGEAASDTSGPDGSTPLGQGWYASVTCGNDDLRVKLAHQSAPNKWSIDPLTRNNLDFTHPSALISDKAGSETICPGHFGSADPAARIISTSINGLQRHASEHVISTGELAGTGPTCHGTLGRMAVMDDTPLPGIYCKGGPSGCPDRSAYTQMMLDRYVPDFAFYGYNGDFKPWWPVHIEFSRRFGTTYCARLCIMNGYQIGRMTTCDPNTSDFGTDQVFKDDPNRQVVCICLK